MMWYFFFNDTATTEIYTLSLHDALPICARARRDAAGHRAGRGPAVHVLVDRAARPAPPRARPARRRPHQRGRPAPDAAGRSEEHTSELQSRQYLVCRLLLEQKNIETHRL